MNKHQLLLTSTLLFSSTSLVSAETFNYTNVGIFYGIHTVDVEGVSENFEGDGVGVNLSIAVLPNVALNASYASSSLDFSVPGTTAKVDIDGIGLGAYYHVPITNTADYFVGINFLQFESDLKVNGTLASSENVNGNSVFLGVRSMVANKIEINALVDRSDIEGSINTSVQLGSAYYIDKSISLDVSYSFDDDGNTLSFGVFKYF